MAYKSYYCVAGFQTISPHHLHLGLPYGPTTYLQPLSHLKKRDIISFDFGLGPTFFRERRLLAIFFIERLLFTFLQERGIYNYKNKNFIKILAPFFVKKDGLKYESPVYAIFCFFACLIKTLHFLIMLFKRRVLIFLQLFVKKPYQKRYVFRTTILL